MRYTFTRKPAKVAAAASTDASRPALTAAWLDTAAGELRATDSDAPDDGGTYSPAGIEQATVASFPRPDVGTPPNLPQLWPEDRGGFTVGINAHLLKRLADALGATDGVVRLTFAEDSAARPNPLRAILVRPTSDPVERADGLAGLAGPEGLIMPVRVP